MLNDINENYDPGRELYYRQRQRELFDQYESVKELNDEEMKELRFLVNRPWFGRQR